MGFDLTARPVTPTCFTKASAPWLIASYAALNLDRSLSLRLSISGAPSSPETLPESAGVTDIRKAQAPELKEGTNLPRHTTDLGNWVPGDLRSQRQANAVTQDRSTSVLILPSRSSDAAAWMLPVSGEDLIWEGATA